MIFYTCDKELLIGVENWTNEGDDLYSNNAWLPDELKERSLNIFLGVVSSNWSHIYPHTSSMYYVYIDTNNLLTHVSWPTFA